MLPMLLAALLLAAHAPVPVPASGPAPVVADPATTAGEVRLLLVRHAEAAGEPAADPGLADEGRARVACLLGALKDEKLTHVVTSPARRTRETAGPIAEALGLQAQARDPLDAAALAAELAALPAGSVALVVGHSNTLPALVAALGGGLDGLVDERGQPALPREQFDRLVRLRLRAGEGDAPRLIALDDGRQPCPKPD